MKIEELKEGMVCSWNGNICKVLDVRDVSHRVKVKLIAPHDHRSTETGQLISTTVVSPDSLLRLEWKDGKDGECEYCCRQRKIRSAYGGAHLFHRICQECWTKVELQWERRHIITHAGRIIIINKIKEGRL